MEKIGLDDRPSGEVPLTSSSVDASVRGLGSRETHSVHLSDNSTLKAVVVASRSTNMDKVIIPSHPANLRPSACEKFNTRKSLAWDNAFFTSEGVLDPEELAIMNNTNGSIRPNIFVAVEEDSRNSQESISTLDSDRWAIENLDVNLFGNLRASIQNSHDRREKIFSAENFSSKVGLENSEIRSFESSKKANVSSKKVLKPPLPTQKHGINKIRLNRTSDEACHAQVHGGNRRQLSSPKPPKINSKFMATPKKIVSATQSVRQMHSEKATPGMHQNVLPLKAVSHGGQFNDMTKTPIKISSGSPTSRKIPSSLIRARGSPHDQVNQNSLDNLRKKVGSRSSDKTLSNSVTKSPMGTPKNNSPSIESINKRGSRFFSSPRANTNSLSKLFVKYSPNSSIESFASESSSSSTSARKVRYTAESLDFSSSSSSWASSGNNTSPSSASKQSRYQGLSDNTNCNFETTSKSLDMKMSLDLSASKVKSAVDCNTSLYAKGLKPSGLRMPTPKIGYFDADKSLVRNSLRLVQSVSPRQTPVFSKNSNAREVDPSFHPSFISSPVTTGTKRLLENCHDVSSSNHLQLKSLNKNHLNSSSFKASKSGGYEPGVPEERHFDVKKCTRTDPRFPEKLCNVHSEASHCILDGQLGIALVSAKRNHEKENIVPSEDKVSKTSRNLELEDVKVATLEMQNRISSLKLSISDAVSPKRAKNFKSFLYHSNNVCQKKGF